MIIRSRDDMITDERGLVSLYSGGMHNWIHLFWRARHPLPCKWLSFLLLPCSSSCSRMSPVKVCRRTQRDSQTATMGATASPFGVSVSLVQESQELFSTVTVSKSPTAVA